MQPATARTPASAARRGSRQVFQIAPRAAQLHAPLIIVTQALTRGQNEDNAAGPGGLAPARHCLRSAPGTVWRDIPGGEGPGRADAAQRFSGPFGALRDPQALDAGL